MDMQSTQSKTSDKPQKSAAILLLMTLLDTTWRAFVPTIGGTFVGVFLDTTFRTVPIITIAMIALGFTTSTILVMMQIKAVKRGSR